MENPFISVIELGCKYEGVIYHRYAFVRNALWYQVKTLHNHWGYILTVN